MSDSAFREWFERQFGVRPDPRPTEHVAIQARLRRAVADDAEYMLRLCREWDARHDAALKAWCARDKAPPGAVERLKKELTWYAKERDRLCGELAAAKRRARARKGRKA